MLIIQDGYEKWSRRIGEVNLLSLRKRALHLMRALSVVI